MVAHAVHVGVLSWSLHPHPLHTQGSGKTYSLGSGVEVEWDGEKEGIIPRALNDIFKALQVLPSHYCHCCTCIADAANKCIVPHSE